MRFLRLWLPALLAAVLLGAAAQAADARKYAVLSLIGDGMLISEWVPSTGSKLDPNVKRFMEISEGVFDKSALLAANETLKRIEPGSEPVLLFARERTLYEAQNRMLDASGGTIELLDLIRQLLRGTGATHLVLFTKLRSEARLKMADAFVGSGTLEGVGFYIDSTMETSDRESLDLGKGLLAPFAYFRLQVIDIARGEIVSEDRVTASYTYSMAKAKADHPWNALSGADKIRVIQKLVADETRERLPRVIRESR